MKLKQQKRALILGSAVMAGLLCGAAPMPAACADYSQFHAQSSGREFAFHHEGVLGTSLELLVDTSSAEIAKSVEMTVLNEINRLCGILSTYDPASHINTVMRGKTVAHRELSDLLSLHNTWKARTAGAIDINMGAVISLWKNAARVDHPPSPIDLQRAKQTPLAWNIDALGKGFVIDRIVEITRTMCESGLINIGGDIRSWGDKTFLIGVTDPARPAENAPLLAKLELRDAAVATSGGYMRYHTIAGERYSHIIDPRTLLPVNMRNAATVVARDCVTANALSTAACVLGLDQCRTLLDKFACDWLVVDEMGMSGTLQTPAPPVAAPAANAATNWPKDFAVSINLALIAPRGGGGKVRRPYIAVWVQDKAGKTIRTITLWGNKEKYIREMTSWWKTTNGDRTIIKSVTRGTREFGKYTVEWDGLDDAGKPVAKGEYSICVEINREHGRHVTEIVPITCGDGKLSAKLKATAESGESTVEYGPQAPPTKAK